MKIARYCAVCPRFLSFLLVTLFGMSVSGASAQDTSPATAVQAAKAIDLSQFPLVDPVEPAPSGSVASLNYQAKGSVESVAKAVQKKLETMGWKALPGASITEAYANAAFQKQGFTLNLTVMPSSEANQCMVVLVNQGNVDLKKMPTVAGAKEIYATSAMRLLQSPVSADETTEQIKKQWSGAGWKPFGDTTATFFVRKNAVRLQVMVSPAPMDPKASMVQISSEQMSADFPELNDVEGLQYSDNPTQLGFDSPKSEEDWVETLGKSMAGLGWRPTTEAPLVIDFKRHWIFRNDAKQLMEIEFSKVDDKTRMRILFQTAAQVEELDKRAKMAAAAALAKRDAEMKRKANPTKIAITAPDGAKLETESATELEFATQSGAAKAAIGKWIAQHVKDGWESKALIEAKEAGEYELTKDGLTLRVGFLDPGFIPGSITIGTSGDAKLELKK